MAAAVFLRRTSIIGPDTLIAVIAIFIVVIKITFFYASFIAVLIVIAFFVVEVTEIVSRGAGLISPALFLVVNL